MPRAPFMTGRKRAATLDEGPRNEMTKTGWIIAIVGLAAATFALATGCSLGLDAGFCADGRATIAPFIVEGSGEFKLTEVVSLIVCLLGVLVAYNAYIDGRPHTVRLAALFTIFFTIALLSENNLMRDDIRPQFLLVLLIWLSVELVIARAFGAILVLVIGIIAPALGQLGDHTTLIEFENLFDTPVSDTKLAAWANTFGALEEPLELAGWLLFVSSAALALDVRPIARDRYRLTLLAVVAMGAIAVGNSMLHLSDNDTYEAYRKIGLFTSVAGVACIGAALLLRHGKQGSLPRAYCAMCIIIAYWVAVYAPSIYTHEHSQTMSSWLWIFPVFYGHYLLVTFRRAYVRDAAQTAHPAQAGYSPT